MLYKKSLSFAVCALTFAGGAAAADPLAMTNQSALARSFALPALGRAQLLADGAYAGSVRLDLTSEYHLSETPVGAPTQAVLLDGEAHVLSLAWRRGFGGGRWEWTAELPVIDQDGGFMDRPIEDWHDWWSLPEGGRPQAPRDRYLYQYRRDGQLLLDVEETGTRLGDARLGLGWQLRPGVALRAEAVLPTGDDQRLAGGEGGGALWADAALPFPAQWILSGFVSAGASYSAKAEVLEDQRRRFIPFGGAGLALQVLPRLSVLGQLYVHAPLYDDSDLDPFRTGLQLGLGLRWQIAQSLSLDIGFQEDPITASSPDFSGHAALNWRP